MLRAVWCLEAPYPAKIAATEADLILRPHYLPLSGVPKIERQSGTAGKAPQSTHPRKAYETRARSHAHRRTRYAGRVRLHAPDAHRAK